MYDRLISDTLASLQAITDAGFTPKIVRALWVQGEGDTYTQEAADAYEGNLREFFEAIWTDLGSRFPVHISELSREKGYQDTVLAAQRTVAAEYDNVSTIDTSGLSFYDGTHYDPASQNSIAKAFVQQVLANPNMPSGSGYVCPRPELKFSLNDDLIDGTEHGDWVNGGAGHDLLLGRNGADTLTGSLGEDRVFGHNGADLLQGGAGNDFLRGGAGRDVLIGNAGYDALEGGANADTFRFLALSESPGDATCDRVLDFGDGRDLIDLRKIDASTLAAGDDAFTFKAEAPLSGIAGELVARTTDAGTTILRGDVDGDRIADFQLILLDTAQIGADDFLL